MTSMTSKNNRARLLYYVKLRASFQSIDEFKLELQSGNAQFGSKLAIFCPPWPWLEILWMTLENNRAPLLYYVKRLCIISNPFVNLNWSYGPETLNSGQHWQYFCPVRLRSLMDDLENDRAHLLYHVKLCESFQSFQWIQPGVTVPKRSIRIKIGDFLSPVNLRFDRWPWKTIGHPFYASSFVHHFIIS